VYKARAYHPASTKMSKVNLDSKTLKQLQSRSTLYDKNLEKITLHLNDPDKKRKMMGCRTALVLKHLMPNGKALAFSAEISRINKAIEHFETVDEAKPTKEALEAFNPNP
jgi:hypothetical protein